MSPSKFKRIREKLGLSQEELAQTFGIVTRAIDHYETGFRNPSALIAALMNIFDNLSDRDAKGLIKLIKANLPKEKSKRRVKEHE